MFTTSGDAKVYVLDKALNYGNSGGPIVATNTGHAHGLCTKFQPLRVRQNHLKDILGDKSVVLIPSLYSVVSSFGNPTILDKMREYDITISPQ